MATQSLSIGWDTWLRSGEVEENDMRIESDHIARTWLVRLFTLACAAGCGYGGALKVQAASDFACPEDSIELEQLADAGGRASGCGKVGWYVYDQKSKWISVLERASFDLECSKEQLTGHEIDRRTVGVSGCGRKGTYVIVDTAWVLNSTSEGQPSK